MKDYGTSDIDLEGLSVDEAYLAGVESVNSGSPHGDYKPWEDEHTIWKTESSYMGWVRSGLRKSVWQRYPIKLNWKKAIAQPLTDAQRKSGEFHTSTKSVIQCVFCETWFPASKIEVDHIEEATSEKLTFDTVESFFYGLVCPSTNYQGACKDCHKCKSHMIRYGFETMEDAKLDKDIIAAMKIKVPKQKQQLLRYGFTEEEITNKEKRKECYRKHILGNKAKKEEREK